jgi:hypothetical protein
MGLKPWAESCSPSGAIECPEFCYLRAIQPWAKFFSPFGPGEPRSVPNKPSSPSRAVGSCSLKCPNSRHRLGRLVFFLRFTSSK